MNINKIFFISDLHFGVRNNSTEWLNNQLDYFYNFFIPTLKSNLEKNDVLFVLGDIFDNRQNIDINVFDSVMKLFVTMSKILPIHIIVGNHDTYLKNNNEVTVLKVFNYIENVTVYIEPTVLYIGDDKSIFMLPWCVDNETEAKFISENNSTYLCSHLDINQVKYNSFSNSKHGNNSEIFKKYERVFNGHIHHNQVKNNIVILGSPYAINRGDFNNRKVINVFNTKTDELRIIENTHSPEFITISFTDLMSMDFSEFESKIKNNYVDIIVEKNSLPDDFPYNVILESVSDYKRISIKFDVYDKENNHENIKIDDGITNIDILHLSNEYINNTEYSEKLKLLLFEKIKEYYNLCAKNEDINNG